MKKLKLSICMMVKNEEKNLRRCLNSIRPLMKEFASELIIVDTGSEDATVEIAREYTEQVYFHQWNHNFAEMRNITIEYAKGDWIFIIDADEEMESLDGIRAFLSTPQDFQIAAAGIHVKSFANSEDRSRYASILSPRIFRRTPAFRYEGIVHNTPIVAGIMVDTGDILFHYGYESNDTELMERKFQRTTKLLKTELQKNPQNIYYRYQLGNSYAMYGDWKVALTELTRARDLCGQDKKLMKEHIYIYGMLMFAYMMNDIKEDEVLEVGLEGLTVEPEYLDLYFFLAQTYIKRKEYDLAKQSYLQYLNLVENFENTSVCLNPAITHYSLQSKVEAVFNLANIYMDEKDYVRSRRWFMRVVENYADRPEFVAQAHRGIVKLDCEMQNFTETSKLYAGLIADEKYVELKKLEGFMEEKWLMMPMELRRLFSTAFLQAPEAYGVLNRTRMSEGIQFEVNFLLQRNWNEMPTYYAVFLLYSLKEYSNGEHLVEGYWQKLPESILMEYMKYLHDVMPEAMQATCRNFLATTGASSYSVVRMKKNIAKYILFSEEYQEDYEVIFNVYVEAGMVFMQSLYGSVVIEQEITVDLKNVEEVFLLYVLKSSMAEELREQFNYLEKALQHYPDLGKGIKILMGKIDTSVASNGMDDLLQQLLPQIQRMIESEKIEEALAAIAEAETIMGVKNSQLLSMKAEVYKKRLASSN